MAIESMAAPRAVRSLTSATRAVIWAPRPWTASTRTQTLVVYVDRGDRRLFGRGEERCRVTDAATGARDQHDPAVETRNHDRPVVIMWLAQTLCQETGRLGRTGLPSAGERGTSI